MATFGSDFNDPYTDFYNLSRLQSGQSLAAGDVAARYADPFMEERQKQIKNLERLQSNPGSIETSPFYKFLMDTQMKAVGANNAARGLTRSGRGAMALQDRAAGVASQAYFPLLQNASQLAMSGSSPSAAGLSYTRGVERSQDQNQAAAAAKAARAEQNRPLVSAAPAMPQAAPTSGYGLPYGGSSAPSSAGYGYTDASTPGYTPSANAGTGYVMSDSGVQGLNGPGSEYYSFGGSEPSYSPTYSSNDYGSDPYSGYDDYSGDFGYGE